MHATVPPTVACGPPMGRLKRQRLLRLGQRSLEFNKRSTRPHDDEKFTRLVIDHAAQFGQRQCAGGSHRSTIEAFAAGSDNFQGRPLVDHPLDARLHSGCTVGVELTGRFFCAHDDLCS